MTRPNFNHITINTDFVNYKNKKKEMYRLYRWYHLFVYFYWMRRLNGISQMKLDS